MDGLCMFFLHLSKFSLIGDLILRVFSVANLVVFEDALDLMLHVNRK